MPNYSPTERIGVNTVERIVVKDLGWIFREQHEDDRGIDAHIELVDNGMETGQLLAVQIKTGTSHFDDTADSYVFRGKPRHLEYWTNHSLPVILVGHLPATGETFWVAIDKSTVEPTKTAWKVKIPKTKLLDSGSREELKKLCEGTDFEQRLRKLAIDEPLMRHLESGGQVALELEDWLHKSLGRSPVKVYIIDTHGNETLSQDWGIWYTGLTIKEVAERLFPWANVSIDRGFYYMNADYEHPDLDGNDDWLPLCPDDRIYPYTQVGGEVEAYRLELTLNDVGKGYLAVADYLNSDS